MLRHRSTVLAAAALLGVTLFTGVREVAAATSGGAPQGTARSASVQKRCATVKVNGKPELQCLLEGPRGPRGRRGPRGARGPQGSTGPRGYVGPGGPRGVEGKAGREGSEGKEGKQGPEGEQGPSGPTGPQGEKGEMGERGERGPLGLQGETGREGKSAPLAYAVVDAAEVSSTASSKGLKSPLGGFTSVHTPAVGVYCLAASGGVEPANQPAAVSGESSYTTTGVPLVELNASHVSCGPGEFEVETRNALAPGALAGGIAFAIVVP